MEGYARQGNVAICRKLVQQMMGQGMRPGAVVYNILLRVCILHPRPDLMVSFILRPWCPCGTPAQI